MFRLSFIIVFVITVLLSACSGGRHTYKRKVNRKKCDCPRWSYQKQDINSNNTFLVYREKI